VPVDALARRLGFQIRFERLAGGVDGRLRVLGDAKVIEVALGQAPSRQRFTIAHELGHFLLGHGYEETKVAERQANIFAGALLAPGAWLARDLGGFPSAAALASRYEVSREVIFIAAKDARLLGRLK
jgi:Zn-dependent peptidase ImmA (M78 family)